VDKSKISSASSSCQNTAVPKRRMEFPAKKRQGLTLDQEMTSAGKQNKQKTKQKIIKHKTKKENKQTKKQLTNRNPNKKWYFLKSLCQLACTVASPESTSSVKLARIPKRSSRNNNNNPGLLVSGTCLITEVSPTP